MQTEVRGRPVSTSCADCEAIVNFATGASRPDSHLHSDAMPVMFAELGELPWAQTHCHRVGSMPRI